MFANQNDVASLLGLVRMNKVFKTIAYNVENVRLMRYQDKP